jgi:hypothetical protein
MTLNDISRLLKLANVPRSKTIQWGYPNPGIIVHVDASHLPIVAEVVNRMRLATDRIDVTLLESRDVVQGQHLYVKVTGETQRYTDAIDAPPSENRRHRLKSVRLRNASVVIDCIQSSHSNAA